MTLNVIVENCKKDGCQLTETQIAHIGNVLSEQRREARSIIRGLLGTQMENAWKPWPRIVALAKKF